MDVETPNPVRRIDDIKLQEGRRFYVPSEIRDEFDVGDGDTIQLAIVEESGERKHFVGHIDSKHRVTIPKRLREMCDIGEGDTVDIEFKP